MILKPFADFHKAICAAPIHGLDSIEMYSIHGGENVKPYGASLKWSDCARADAAIGGPK